MGVLGVFCYVVYPTLKFMPCGPSSHKSVCLSCYLTVLWLFPRRLSLGPFVLIPSNDHPILLSMPCGVPSRCSKVWTVCFNFTCLSSFLRQSVCHSPHVVKVGFVEPREHAMYLYPSLLTL